MLAHSAAEAEALFQDQLRGLYRIGAQDQVIAVSQEVHGENRYYRMQQTYRGLEVRGGELVLQTDLEGRVAAVMGTVRDGIDLRVGRIGFTEKHYIHAIADYLGIPSEAAAKLPYRVLEQPDLVVYAPNDAPPVLAFEFVLEFVDEQAFYMERMYLNVKGGQLENSVNLIHSALERRIHDVDGGCLSAIFGASLPGQQVISEGGSSSDEVAQGAYDNTGATWWFYHHMFDRDSWDGNGIPLVSTVHITFSTGIFPVNCSPNNAAFLPAPYNQMVYGDGDGQILKETALSLDVTAHELTHGVTNSTSNLVYQRESGAINEAMSDIFGAGTEAWVQSLALEGKDPSDGNPAQFRTFRETWLLGDDIAGSQLGEALRYMDNPTEDGRSADYYPERNYPNCTPNSSNDNCGVHTNSGIANLAFYLLCEGGTHPRGKTNVQVPAIGIVKALHIFYETNAQLLTSNATFEDLRYASAQAAVNQFGENSCEYVAIMKAWDAVGINGGWTDPGVNCGGPTNDPPTAAFSFSTDRLDATFDASASSDSDGTISQYAWDFGDGNSGSGQIATHAYAADGSYQVTLTVTDNDGAVDATTQTVTVSDDGNEVPPTAVIRLVAEDLTVDVDGTGSSTQNGSIVAYDWDFGDGAIGTGATALHDYAAVGTYEISLTVTDEAGLSDSARETVTVTDPGDDCGNGFAIGSRTITFNNDGRNIQTDVYYPSDTGGSNAPILEGCDFPVLVFGHGFTIGTNAYGYLSDGLVPAGYIVALPRTESGFSPSHARFGEDLAFVVGAVEAEFASSVSGTSAVMGHSMGGGSAFLAMADNPQITALVTLAAAETNPSAIAAAGNITNPALVVAASRDCITPPAEHQIPMFEALASADKELVTIEGGSHCQFTTGNFNCSFGELFCGQRPNIGADEQHAATIDAILPWLERVLE